MGAKMDSKQQMEPAEASPDTSLGEQDRKNKDKKEQDRKLHETLKESFPASDPPSTGQTTGRETPKSRIDKPAAPVVPPDVQPKHHRR